MNIEYFFDSRMLSTLIQER